MRKVSFAVTLFAIVLVATVSLLAQQSPNLENGFKHWGSYDGGGIDTIGTLNGNQMLHAPLTSDYPQRGGLTLGDILYNTSKTWQMQCSTDSEGGTTCY